MHYLTKNFQFDYKKYFENALLIAFLPDHHNLAFGFMIFFRFDGIQQPFKVIF